jgi:hypothetical protein
LVVLELITDSGGGFVEPEVPRHLVLFSSFFCLHRFSAIVRCAFKSLCASLVLAFCVSSKVSVVVVFDIGVKLALVLIESGVAGLVVGVLKHDGCKHDGGKHDGGKHDGGKHDRGET